VSVLYGLTAVQQGRVVMVSEAPIAWRRDSGAAGARPKRAASHPSGDHGPARTRHQSQRRVPARRAV